MEEEVELGAAALEDVVDVGDGDDEEEGAGADVEGAGAEVEGAGAEVEGPGVETGSEEEGLGLQVEGESPRLRLATTSWPCRRRATLG